MKLITSFKLICGICALVATLVAGCESTGGGGNVSSGTNYGTGMNDPRPPEPVIMINPTTGAGPRGGGGR
jgi:hypothetical protein